jgi:bacteriocin leader peptide (microcyclamide/patellamide family)
MNKKNLIPQTTQPLYHLTIQDLSTELVELSEEVLSKVGGGWKKLNNLDNLPVLEPLGGINYIIWNPPSPSISQPLPPVRIPHAL